MDSGSSLRYGRNDEFGRHSGFFSILLKMLEAFFAHVGSYKGAKYLHWNMRDINYGFAALEYRYKVLRGDPIVIDDDKKFDLSRLLIDIYGTGYVGHPRLEKLLEKNSIRPLNFMTGKQEAEAFEQRNFVGLHQSTRRKVDILANFATRAHDRNLRTNTTWWEMHRGHLRSVLEWLIENKVITFLASIASLSGLGLYFLFRN